MKHLLSNVSLAYKIALAPALVALCLCIVTAAGTFSSERTRAVVLQLADSSLPRIARTGAIGERTANLNGMVMQSLAYEGIGLKAETIAALDKRIGAEFAELSHEFDDLESAVARDQPEALKQVQSAHAAFKAFQASVKDTLDMKSMGLASAYGVMARSETSYAELRKSLAAMSQGDVQQGDSVAQAAASAVGTTISTSWVLAGLALLVSAVVTWWMARSILLPLRRAVQIAGTVASGDLSSRIEAGGNDETGQLMRALGAMNSSLVEVVQRVRSGSESIATGSTEIASGNADLSQRTEQQASSLQQTAASMEQLNATVKANAEAARTAARLAAGASAVAQEGGAVVGQVVATMQEISTASSKIADIVGVIDGIAFQTNILALNAAVEAARAGEQGRGFAVVASEVRLLAQRSASAAREIKQLIGSSADRVESGAELVGRAGATMADIVAQVKRVSEIIVDIDNAAGEQTRGIGQINDAVTQLDQVTQQNAALVEESAAASASLQHQAQRLVQVVGAFRIAAAAEV